VLDKLPAQTASRQCITVVAEAYTPEIFMLQKASQVYYQVNKQ
jgi:hypothetical protein